MNNRYCIHGSIVQKGVDLNRNYGFHYGETKGDSNQCGETFRGPNAFSEPETKAVRSFVSGDKHITSAMNFHSFGNMWIHPFNYMKVANKFPKTTLHSVVDFYKEFGKEVHENSDGAYGNAIEMVNYATDGEASDWMLGERGIISFSPELGSLNPQAQDFIIPKSLIFSVIQENFKVIELFLEKNVFKMTQPLFGFDNKDVFSISFKNKGLADVHNPILVLLENKENKGFLESIYKVSIETAPFQFEHPKIEKHSDGISVHFKQIKHLEHFKINFSFSSKSFDQTSFTLPCELHSRSGDKFAVFELNHSVAERPQPYTYVLVGAGGMLAAFTLFLLLCKMAGKFKGLSKVETQ